MFESRHEGWNESMETATVVRIYDMLASKLE